MAQGKKIESDVSYRLRSVIATGLVGARLIALRATIDPKLMATVAALLSSLAGGRPFATDVTRHAFDGRGGCSTVAAGGINLTRGTEHGLSLGKRKAYISCKVKASSWFLVNAESPLNNHLL